MSRMKKEHLSVLCAILAVLIVAMKTYSNMAAKCEAVERVTDVQVCYDSWKEQLPNDHWVSRKFATDVTWVMVDTSITLKNIGYLMPVIYADSFAPAWMKPLFLYSTLKDYRKDISADTDDMRVGDLFTYTLIYQGEPVQTMLEEDVFEGRNADEIADQLLQFSFSYSENPSVAKFSEDGTVTLVGEGKTNLVIVHNGQKFLCPVTVH